jgi:hypothetical protein
MRLTILLKFFFWEEEGRTRGGKLGSVYLEDLRSPFSLCGKFIWGYTISTREGLDVWILLGVVD